MNITRTLAVIGVCIIALCLYVGLGVAESSLTYEESTGAVIFTGCSDIYGSDWQEIKKPWIDGNIYTWCHNTATGQDLLMGE